MAALLIVEDDRKTNEALCEYLRAAGHEIIPAYDGDEALQIFGRGDIDLVVLDIMLPKVSGLSVLHEIRQKSSVPILMLTALEDEYTQVTSFDEQADDYITKPFSMILLGRRITALLRRCGKGAVSDIMTVTPKDGFGEDVVVSIKDDSALSDIPSGQDTAPEVEVSADGAETDTEQIRVTIDFYNMLQLYFVGIIVIILSVGISSMSVMCLKPREILSKMN